MTPDLPIASDPDIRRLERLADAAWPAAIIEEHDGWLLRWAEGPWHRTNSVAPLGAGRVPLAAKIDHAERWYQERGRAPCFKLTAASRPGGLEDDLERRGYLRGFSVSMQARPIADPPASASLRLDERPTPDWLAAKRRIGALAPARIRHLPALLSRIPHPVAYGLVEDHGIPAAIALAVLTEDHVGVFDLAVDSERRRRGLATRLIEGLASWGAARGARTVYLQVETANDPALALYRKLGFVEVYRYWYRVTPDVAGPQG